jgi:adenylosuccinate lyase
MANLNVLSERYATAQMNEIFSARNTIILEREMWIAVVRAQRRLGLDIPAEAIEKYERARDQVDLGLIRSLEEQTKHDLVARIEAFNRAAGAEGLIHLGMTSRDVTDNVAQIQIKRALRLIFGKYLSVLRHLADRSTAFADILLVARTHHQPAQVTLLGRRLAMWAEELLLHLSPFEGFLGRYPLRGIKGPVGTQRDMASLLGDPEKVLQLEGMVAEQMGFSTVLEAPGQVYPRSLDLELLSHLSILAAAPENFAKGMRLMAGYELVSEGFAEGQVGSSAMPHKMNTRSSERICALAELIKMYADGASRISGDQWEEGDVSCSAIRRVIIPDACYASDGLCETMLVVLGGMGAYPAALQRELELYLPYLATAEILGLAIKRGIPREVAHTTIRHHAISAAMAWRAEGKRPSLATALAQDPHFARVGITEPMIAALLDDKRLFVGNAQRQIKSVVQRARHLLEKYPQEAAYEPGVIC